MRVRLGRWLICAAMVAASVASHGQRNIIDPVPKGPAQAFDQQVAKWLTEQLAEMLALPVDLPLDDDLRRALQTMVGEHLQRSREMFLAWSMAERARAGAPTSNSVLSRQLFARFVNELALWHLDSLGARLDDPHREVLLHPRRCLLTTTYPAFAKVAWGLQSLAPTARAQALTLERMRLAKMGLPRATLAPRPEPSLDEVIELQRAQLTTPGWRAALPMSPLVAANMFGDSLNMDSLHPSSRCAMRQWALMQWVAARPQESETAMMAWRYASLADTLGSFVDPEPTEKTGSADYPAKASRFEVEGTTRVKVTFDAMGAIARSEIVRRDVHVPGVRGVRAVAFETMFDGASLARARLPSVLANFKPGDSAGKQHVLDYVWKLEP